jgi:short-subunit dehydrogenase
MMLKDKVVVITGASEGIGAAIARAVAKLGAKLVLAARSSDKLEKLAMEIDTDAVVVPTDMRDVSQIKKLVADAVAHFGRIDVFINNAGQGMYGPVESIDVKHYREILELNVLGPLQAMQAVIPQLRSQGGGMILNISSMVSKNYYPSIGAYASTKYALNALSLTARQELEKDHIIVSVFHPKMTATRFGDNAIDPIPLYRERRPGMMIDTAEQVAEQVVKQIESEEAERNM